MATARLDVRTVINLTDHTGQPFFQTMQALKPALDADAGTPLQIPAAKAINQALSNSFAPDVTRGIQKSLADPSKFGPFVDSFRTSTKADVYVIDPKTHTVEKDSTGSSVTKSVPISPLTIGDVIFHEVARTTEGKGVFKNNQPPADLAPVIALTANTGVCVAVGKSGFYYQTGYAPGGDRATLSTDVMTGRAYAETANRRVLDPSDPDYLSELKKYLLASSDPGPFYEALLKILVSSDPSGVDALATDPHADRAITTALDFIAVYHAEGARNLMDPSLKAHSWQKDLFAATALASYFTAAGGDPDAFWAKSTVTNPDGTASDRSGIGVTREQRAQLAQKVCDAEKTISAKRRGSEYANLEKLIGRPKSHEREGALIHHLADYLNEPHNMRNISKNGDAIIAAATAFLTAINKDATEIAKTAGNALPPPPATKAPVTDKSAPTPVANG